MPPRFAYWTIIAGGQPTAFRAATPEELLPTLKQLQSKHPDAVMRWFSRGKLWDSPAEATAALREQRAAGRPRRGSDWRPGGQHQDPRDRFKVPRDVKRERFAARLRRDRAEGEPDGGARPFSPKGDRPFTPKGDRPFGQKGDRPFRPKGDRPFQPGGDRPFTPKGPRPPGGGTAFRGRGGGGSFRGGPSGPKRPGSEGGRGGRGRGGGGRGQR